MMATAPTAEGSNRAAVTVCVILATIMQALDTTIANIALPYIQGSVAASQDQTGSSVMTALRRSGIDADAALDEAEQRGVVVRDRGALRFRHPLLRTAAWRLAQPAQRRAESPMNDQPPCGQQDALRPLRWCRVGDRVRREFVRCRRRRQAPRRSSRAPRRAASNS